MIARHLAPSFGLWRGAIVVLGALLGLPSAQAVAVSGPGGTQAQARRVVPARPAETGTAVAPLELVRGRIDAVNLASQQLTISGKPVGLVTEQLRVIGPGGHVAASASALRPGMQVRFALEPASKDPKEAREAKRRIVVIYIDS